METPLKKSLIREANKRGLDMSVYINLKKIVLVTLVLIFTPYTSVVALENDLALTPPHGME